MELLHKPGEIVAQRYRIVDTLGQGGSGTTYRAEDLQSGESVALKALSLHRVTDWKAIALFEREARVLAQLNHPGIPRYLDYFQVDTPGDRFFYIAQQLAPGQSLAELVQIGLRLLNAFILSPLSHTRLTIYQNQFFVQQWLRDWDLQNVTGNTPDIRRVELKGIGPITVCALKGLHQYYFGSFLTQSEKEWLVWEIRTFLEKSQEPRNFSKKRVEEYK